MGTLQGRGICMGTINKKGIFFTFIAIAMMVVFILVFTPQAGISLEKDREAISIRTATVDNYVSELQNDYFETVLRATTYKTILSLIFYINETDSYITDLDSAFYEVMLNGTINGFPIDDITGKKIMENSTLTDWTKLTINISKDTLNVDTAIIITNVSVSQLDTWYIKSNLGINFTVKSNVAEWKKNINITTTVSIEGFLDPYYLVNTNGLYANVINKSTVEFNEWNITKVREHLRYGTYAHWENPDAPSFLMR